MNSVEGLRVDVDTILNQLIDNVSLDDNEYEALLDRLVAMGKKTLRPLLNYMSDDDPDKRYVANEAYSRVFASLSSAELLDYLVSGDDERLRSEAAYWLGMNNVKSAVDSLIVALRDRSPRVRKAAAQALGMLGDKKAAQALAIAQEDLNPIVRQQATIALALLEDWRHSLIYPQLLKDAQHESAAVRAGAMEALGMINDDRVIYALFNGLSDPEPEVRTQAARALIRHPDRRAISYLNAALNDEDEWVRYYASQALYWIEDALPNASIEENEMDTAEIHIEDLLAESHISAERLVQQIRHEDINVRLRAIAAASTYKVRDAVGALMGCLHDERLEIRRAAAEALGNFNEPMVSDWLVIAACHDDPILHNNAIRSLHKLGDVRVRGLLPYIEKDLRHKDAAIRQLAANTMGILKLDTAVDILCELLTDRDMEVRIAAANALGQIGDVAAIEALIRAANDPDYRLRIAIAEAISQMKTPRSLFILLALLRDKEPEVRYAAALGLHQLGDVRAIPYLVTFLADESADVATAIAATLQALTEKRERRLSNGE